VLNINIPLTPLAPAFEVWINRFPLENVELDPLTIDTRPPDAKAATEDELVPARNTTSAPIPLFPEPTVRYNAPPRPDAAAPEPIIIAPLLPELEVPVLRTRTPLTPEAPELAVWRRRSPLDVVTLKPL